MRTRGKRVYCDGHWFGSGLEMRHYQDLVLREKAGEISDLRVHPKFVLAPAVRLGGRRKPKLTFEADFSYMENGELVVCDVKPRDRKTGKWIVTAVYRVKKHLMMSVHGIEVVEVGV